MTTTFFVNPYQYQASGTPTEPPLTTEALRVSKIGHYAALQPDPYFRVSSVKHYGIVQDDPYFRVSAVKHYAVLEPTP